MHANGSFDVALTPQAPEPGVETNGFGRMSIDKQFHSELETHSLGEMIAASTDVPGSAGYVAMERLTGTLHGRQAASYCNTARR